MILLTILAIILVVLVVLAVAVMVITGGLGIVLFGDVIVAVWIVWMLVKFIHRRKH